MSFHKAATEKLLGPLNDVERKYAPDALFYQGHTNLLDAGPRVSVVGTRHPSDYAVEATASLSAYLVSAGAIVVSGLAMGIDTTAHRSAIDAGGGTIAVLGTPLDTVSPRQNRDLQTLIGKQHLLLSEFLPGTPVQRHNFPRRNRTMALISDATLIVEAGPKSGTIHQGWEALRLGRPLFLLDSFVDSVSIEWVNDLIDYGAEVIAEDDIGSIFDYVPPRGCDPSELAL